MQGHSNLTLVLLLVFRWYQDSYECIVYLGDVPLGDSSPSIGFEHLEVSPYAARLRQAEYVQRFVDIIPPGFQDSAWFTRGWTLQELLAPSLVLFCNSNWEVFGHVCRHRQVICTRDDCADGIHLNEVVASITRIHELYLRGSPLAGASIAQRMSWASCRETTRPEDEAYCLLGIFGINMPMLYGEGRRAFRRLQLEIIQSSNDESIFAWADVKDPNHMSMLASSPVAFADAYNITRMFSPLAETFTTTNKGLRFQKDLYLSATEDENDTRLIRLACQDGETGPLVLKLVRGADRYLRLHGMGGYFYGLRGFTTQMGTLLGEEVIYINASAEHPHAAEEQSRDFQRVLKARRQEVQRMRTAYEK